MLYVHTARPIRLWSKLKTAAFVLAVVTVLQVSFGITAPVLANPAVPSGQYTGYHTDDPERQLIFSVSDTGQIGTIYTEYTTSCYYQPLTVMWEENPPIQIAADGTFYAEWIIEDPNNSDNDIRHTFQGSISSTGVASGTMSSYYYKLETCNDRTEAWIAAPQGVTIADNPTITLSTGQVTQDELADTGITVTGSGFAAGGTVTFSIGTVEAGSAAVSSDGTFTATAQASMYPDTYTLTASIGNQSASAELVVEAGEEYNPEIMIEPSPIDDDVLFTQGVKVSGSGFPPNAPLTVTISTVEAGSTVTEEDGTFELIVRGTAAIGANLLTARSGKTSNSMILRVEPGEGTIVTSEATTLAVSAETDTSIPGQTDTGTQESGETTDSAETSSETLETETTVTEPAEAEATDSERTEPDQTETEPAATVGEGSDSEEGTRGGLGLAVGIGVIVALLALSGVLLYRKQRKN